MGLETLSDLLQRNIDSSGGNSPDCVKFIGHQISFTLNKPGIMKEILTSAAKKFNFCFNLTLVPETIPYGTFFPKNKTYNGVLGALQRREYEGNLDSMSLSIDHLYELESTNFLNFDPTTVAMPYPVFTPNIFGFLLPLSWQMWAATVGASVSVALSYFILTYFGSSLNNSEPESSSFWQMVFKGFYISLEILLGQDIYNHGVGDRRLKIRLLVCVWLLVGFIVSQSYKCNLKSMLIKPKVHLAFETLEEMVNQKEIKYFTLKGTLLDQLLKSDPPVSSFFGRMNQGRIEFPINATKLLATGKYAFISTTRVNLLQIQLTFKERQCALTVMPEKLNIIGLKTMGIYFQVGSKYRHYFNNVITSFREAGILDFIESLLYNNAQKCMKVTNPINDEQALSLKDYYGLAILYISGLFLAFLAFLGEVLIFHLKSWMEKKKNKRDFFC